MGALYDLAVGAHVLTVLGALVSIGVAGGYSGAALAGAGEGVRRYFRRGPSWGPRLLVPAAVFGVVAAALSRGRVRLDSGWVLAAAGLWLVAMAAVEAVLRPAESALASGGTTSPRPAAARALAGAGAALAAVVAASVVMSVR